MQLIHGGTAEVDKKYITSQILGVMSNENKTGKPIFTS